MQLNNARIQRIFNIQKAEKGIFDIFKFIRKKKQIDSDITEENERKANRKVRAPLSSHINHYRHQLCLLLLLLIFVYYFKKIIILHNCITYGIIKIF